VSQSPERTLPCNLEAERSVLGAILVHNTALDVAAPILTATDFYRDAHARIYAAMLGIHTRGGAIDFVTLRADLTRRGDLDEVGGPAYISSLADGVPKATNVEYYARLVKEQAALRSLIYAANTMLTEAYEGAEPAAALLHRADQALLGIAAGHGPVRMSALRSSSAALFADLEYSATHQGQLRGIDTGYPSINQETYGWQAGDLIVLAARPSIGKSTFTMNTAVAAAKTGKRVAVFSLEMRRRQLERRLMSSLSGVALSRIVGGYLGALDYPRVSEALQTMQDLPISIDDRGGVTFWDVRTTCRRMRADVGLDMVVIDYVQLMRGSLDRRGASRNDEITDISRRLKEFADECAVPVLLVSQLNRAAAARTDKRPQLSDLRESGALEQDADIVAFLHRDSHRTGGTTAFIIEKARNGPTGSLNLTFERDISTFLDGGEEPPAEPAPMYRRSSRRRPPREDPRLPD
jgi:replicative DNA helicase